MLFIYSSMTCCAVDLSRLPFRLCFIHTFHLHLLFQLVKEVINPDAEITYQENTADDPTRRRPDITKMRNKYGWEPKIVLKDGLQRMVEDFKRRLHVE